uniref:Uncharacterized protein n=1 Tax=Trichogramma kaykai TaxID=54128 RepID=A0ABD2WQ90_9HYME
MKIVRLLSTLMPYMVLTGYFCNESLAIKIFSSQNITINEEKTYSNQSKIMGICKRCVKSIQADRQNVQQENSIYESYTVSINPTHFNRRSKKSDGISNDLNYKSKSLIMSSLSHNGNRNESKSIFKIIKQDNNYIIEWKCELSLLIFTLIQNKNFPNTPNAILASYSANTKKYKTMNETLQLCKIICRKSNVDESDRDLANVHVSGCQDTLHNCTLQALTKSMFNNESLQIKVLKSKNNTFNKGTNYFNQSEIMNENCTKMIQVIISTIDKQSIQHEVSTYKARSITIAPPYFIRLKRFGVHHVLSRIPRPPLRNSSPDSNKINQSESALKTVLQQCNNLIIELKCEPSIFAFIITQYSQLPMTLDAFPVTNTKKYKITNEVR